MPKSIERKKDRSLANPCYAKFSAVLFYFKILSGQRLNGLDLPISNGESAPLPCDLFVLQTGNTGRIVSSYYWRDWFGLDRASGHPCLCSGWVMSDQIFNSFTVERFQQDSKLTIKRNTLMSVFDENIPSSSSPKVHVLSLYVWPVVTASPSVKFLICGIKCDPRVESLLWV